MTKPTTLATPRLSPISGISTLGRREARLRPEYSERYPGVPAGVWEPAATLADCVTAGGLLRMSPVTWRDRALEDEHFEFRGGEEREDERPRREDR
jgi:hypothetical protein